MLKKTHVLMHVVIQKYANLLNMALGWVEWNF